jgi:tetraacyldisaccharide 4'-kinase
LRPGILLRGYGGDEGSVHRKLAPEAIVVETPNRIAGAFRAVAEGAEVIVLDDAYQRLDIERDLNILVLSAESRGLPRWTLPAGPWREGWNALGRADLMIVSRKSSSHSDAAAFLERVRRATKTCPTALARLEITGFHGMQSGRMVAVSEIRGASVVAAAGIADPDSFAIQCEKLGADVRPILWRDHQKLSDNDLMALASEGRNAEFTIVTEKDACKMRGRWPGGYDEPLVADLDLIWEAGGDAVEAALDATVAPKI